MSQQAIAFDRSEFEQSVVMRFEKVAAELPAHLAIIGDADRWTYGQLDQRVNQIARAIVERTAPGVGCVAYLVGHCPNMVICALATLKAAKAYLCIHPGLPAAAQRDVVSDAGPDLLISDKPHEAAARDLAGDRCAVVILEEIGEGYAIDSPAINIDSHHPAAIFYTSGSTGRPKGVVKSHRALLHRAWLCARYDFVTPADRQSLLTFCSFASSEADLFGALLNGATLDLFDVGSRGLEGFGAWINEHRLTLLHPPVVLFRRYLASLEGANLHPSVRLVALAGEAVLAADIERWRARFSPACALRHRFSSTEAGHVAVACVEPGDAMLPARAVEDKHLSVVDEQGCPVSDGEAGELVVRSAFLSDGYWRRTTETAADFAIDPLHPDERVFHSGDRGRLLADGRFEFLGRADDQVKIRGYRVQTREVENAFLKLAGVKEAAVIDERHGDETRLIGFVVMQPGSPFRAESLRAEMRSFLPQWKIPSQIHAVDTLPLTLTGKIDRQRLKSSVKGDAAPEATRIDSDPAIAQLVVMWEVILGRKGIDPDDDFFDLGGHSLLAVQLMLEIRTRFGRSLPIAVLFDAPTPRRLAKLIGLDAGIDKTKVLVALKESGRHAPLFCVPAANGSALTYLPLARLVGDEHPVYSLQFGGEEADGNIRVGSVEQIAGRFVEHVRRVRPDGPYRLCGHSFGAVIAYEMAQQLVAGGAQIDLLAMFDGRAPGSRRQLPAHRRLLRHLAHLSALGPSAAIADVACRLRRRLPHSAGSPGADDADADRELFSSSADAREARVRAVRAYRPRPYPGVITLFRATVEPDWAQYNFPQPLNGWDAHCQRIELHPIQGDHLSLLREPALSVLASVLNECLDRPAQRD